MVAMLVGEPALCCDAGLEAQATRPTTAAGEPGPDSLGNVAPTSSSTRRTGDSIVVRLVDVDLRTAIQALAQYLDFPVLLDAAVQSGAGRITLESPRPVVRDEILPLLRGVLDAQRLDFTFDSTARFYRVRRREPMRPAPEEQQSVQQPLALGAGQSGPGGMQAPELFVIHLRHARAADVAATVNALYGRASALGELGAPAPGAGPTLGQQLNGNGLAPVDPAAAPPNQTMAEAPMASGRPGRPAASGAELVEGAAGRVAQLTGEITIVPDANSNALFVRAGRSDFELINAAVQALDVRPLQVLIEVVIAEVQKDRSFSFGVEASTPEGDVPGLNGVRAKASQKGIGLGDFALHIMRQGPGVDFDATLRASAARGDARILSRPVVLASNGEPAEILVGSQRPFVQVQRSLPTETPSRDQVVQYKDVGTRLTIRPTISADGYVAIALTQEVNAATTETQFDAPVISTRTVQTSLLVRDSQTVVLGGLSDRQREASQGGVPVLSSIPLLGGLFGRASRRSTETEFFLFLTPRIIRTDEDADAVTGRFQRKAGAREP
jgi:general secretion pathway protein D